MDGGTDGEMRERLGLFYAKVLATPGMQRFLSDDAGLARRDGDTVPQTTPLSLAMPA